MWFAIQHCGQRVLEVQRNKTIIATPFAAEEWKFYM